MYCIAEEVHLLMCQYCSKYTYKSKRIRYDESEEEGKKPTSYNFSFAVSVDGTKKQESDRFVISGAHTNHGISRDDG